MSHDDREECDSVVEKTGYVSCVGDDEAYLTYKSRICYP